MDEPIVETPKKRGRPKGQRGPCTDAVNAYLVTPAQAFFDNIREAGIEVYNKDTGQGVFVGPSKMRSARTESGYDMALVAFEFFKADKSVCCNDNARIEGETTHFWRCVKCGQPCDVKQISVRKPTYVINPKTHKRFATWNQVIIASEFCKGIAEAILKLIGVETFVAAKQEMVKDDVEMKDDKRLRELERYGL